MAKKRSRRRTRQLGERLARACLEQRGYRAFPAEERGTDFHVIKGAPVLPVKVMPIRYGNWQFSVDRLMEVSISRQGIRYMECSDARCRKRSASCQGSEAVRSSAGLSRQEPATDADTRPGPSAVRTLDPRAPRRGGRHD